ncbi:MAG: response regulator transcription factor [Saprospiraceae bacterium]|nr:response regulator transcription factor [Saprospiraceae bacterium]
MKANLAIIEDEPVILKSLTTFFENTESFAVIFTARRVEDLHALNQEEIDLDIILLDINLLGMSGIQGIPKILEMFPKVNIVMLTTFDQNEYIFEALKAGATGYIVKDTPIWDIKSAMETIQAGGSFMSPGIARKVMASFHKDKNDVRFESLTNRQNEILNALVEGLSYKMIADRMGISTHTTCDHIKAIYRKLQVNSKGEAINLALTKKKTT